MGRKAKHHKGSNKSAFGLVSEASLETCPALEIPTIADVLHTTDKSDHSIRPKDEITVTMTNDQRTTLEPASETVDDKNKDEQLEEQQESENGNLGKRRRKKEKQRVKKLARKMAAQRRESELSLGEFREDEKVATAASSSQITITRKVSLYRCPLVTLEYFLREIPCLLGNVQQRYLGSRKCQNGDFSCLLQILLVVLIVAAGLIATYLWIATNDSASVQIKQTISWHLYWIVLGILSSIGLGTGLHTFVLYLGPFIAKVSLAAQECNSLNFPQPPYPYQVLCPTDNDGDGHYETPSIMTVSNKVRWETLAWGFGTALGELPPYFIARAASLTGDKSYSNDLENQEGFLAKVQLKMRDFVRKVGFWGILLCASIPNPLFDLAGITCGHFQVPFTVFFGATAIGKTIIKSQLQMIFVILAFNEKSLERILQSIGNIPNVGPTFSKAITDFMDYQRATLRNKNASESGGILKLLMEILVIAMILYFIGSIINGMARNYQKRITPKAKKSNGKARRVK